MTRDLEKATYVRLQTRGQLHNYYKPATTATKHWKQRVQQLLCSALATTTITTAATVRTGTGRILVSLWRHGMPLSKTLLGE